jgi:colanic acid/amylovoran biosynthesis glycosyltransferase
VKIAFMVGEFPSLSETFILDQITALIERGHRVSILAEREGRDADEHPDVARFGLRAVTRYERLPGAFLQRVAALPSVWRGTAAHWRALDVARFGGMAASLRLTWGVHLCDDDPDFDVVQCHFGALGLKAVLLRQVGALRGRIVTAFHGEDITNYPRRFRGSHFAPLFAHGDRFLPISARWNAQLEAMGCPREKIHVHRMGIDLRNFPERAARPSSSVTRMLSVSRLVEKKGIGDAIRAVAASSAPCEYVVAGDGPLRAELETLARDAGVASRVRFVGAQTREQVATLLQSADLFVAPSVTGADGDIEGIPVSIMEAMAAELPVISTHHSGIPELVTDGVEGMLVPERDVAALTACIDTLAADHHRRARMGAAGRARVAVEFEMGALTSQLEAHYRSLVSAHAHAHGSATQRGAT